MKKSKLFIFMPIMVFTAFIFSNCNSKYNNNNINNNTKDNTNIVLVNNSKNNNTATNDETEESVKKKFSELVNTYIIPLVSGLSVTTILSAGVSIAFAIVNRKNNIKSKESVLTSSALILETIKSNNELIKQVIETKKVNEESINTFISQTDKLINEVATVTEQTELLEKLKVSQKQVINALSLISTNTKELVVNGTANKIEEINNEIKGI